MGVRPMCFLGVGDTHGERGHRNDCCEEGCGRQSSEFGHGEVPEIYALAPPLRRKLALWAGTHNPRSTQKRVPKDRRQ